MQSNARSPCGLCVFFAPLAVKFLSPHVRSVVFVARTAIPPGPNGYPDVDTWRNLLFYVQAE